MHTQKSSLNRCFILLQALLLLVTIASTAALAGSWVEVTEDTPVYRVKEGKLTAIGKVRAGKKFKLAENGQRAKWVEAETKSGRVWIPASKSRILASNERNSRGTQSNHFSFELDGAYSTSLVGVGFGGGLFGTIHEDNTGKRLEIGTSIIYSPNAGSGLISSTAFSLSTFQMCILARYRIPIDQGGKFTLFPEGGFGLFMVRVPKTTLTNDVTTTDFLGSLGGGASFEFASTWLVTASARAILTNGSFINVTGGIEKRF